MEQKTEASQAVDERALFEQWAGDSRYKFVALQKMSGERYVHPGVQADWEVWQARAALKGQPQTQCSREAVISECVAALTTHLGRSSRVDVVERNAIFGCREVVAALKAQPAPREATEKPFGYFIVEGDDLPYPGSGFIRELAEGRLYRSVTPVYTRPAPTEAAQGEDSARLDWIEREAIQGGTYHDITSANVIVSEKDWRELGLRAAIDKRRARASAETGGVKS